MTLAVGTEVRTRPQRPSGHTRLPRYLQDARGVIVHVIGTFAFPDEVVAAGGTARKSNLYTVAFSSSDIFDGNAAGTICADLFEDYLEVIG